MTAEQDAIAALRAAGRHTLADMAETATAGRMYPPFAEAGRARCSVIPVLTPAATEAAHVVPEALAIKTRPATFTGLTRARVYRPAGDTAFGPLWHWRCCDTVSIGCAHGMIHKPGTWHAAMCGALRHAHTRHPPSGPKATTGHTTMFGRRRCDWSQPTREQIKLAEWTLCGRLGMPQGTTFREFAREILALAGARPD